MPELLSVLLLVQFEAVILRLHAWGLLLRGFHHICHTSSRFLHRFVRYYNRIVDWGDTGSPDGVRMRVLMEKMNPVPDWTGETVYILLVVVSFGLLRWFWTSLWVPSWFPF
jgi:hypothetical protein